MIKNKMTGEMSMPPRFGSMLRIGRSTGSVMRIEKIADHRDDLVPRVHHVEGDQPGKDRHRDHDPDVELQGEIDDEKKCAHGPGFAFEDGRN